MTHDGEPDGQEEDLADLRDDADDWEPLEFPNWVTIAIGVTLVVLASLQQAVSTCPGSHDWFKTGPWHGAMPAPLADPASKCPDEGRFSGRNQPASGIAFLEAGCLFAPTETENNDTVLNRC